MGLKAGILASRLGFGSEGWDLGLKAGIVASLLEFGPRVGFELGGGGTKEEEEEEGVRAVGLGRL